MITKMWLVYYTGMISIIGYLIMKTYKKLMKDKSDIIHNDSDNMLYVQSRNGRLVIICNTLNQIEQTQQRLYKHGNVLTEVEEWDEENDKKYILTFNVGSTHHPIYN